jgi:hypothetical protein
MGIIVQGLGGGRLVAQGYASTAPMAGPARGIIVQGLGISPRMPTQGYGAGVTVVAVPGRVVASDAPIGSVVATEGP